MSQVADEILNENRTKVRSCYRVSILSNQADKNFFITSKNNNKIAGIAESVKL
jgi:hypothetical protein